MVNILIKMTDEERAEYAQWTAERPEAIRKMIARLPPDRLYRNTETGQVMAIQAFAEDGTVRAYVLPECNGPVTGGSVVFGLDPDHLEPATQEYVDERETVFAVMATIFNSQEPS